MSDGPGARRRWDSIGGLWKLACALAVLLGHNAVTIMAIRPDLHLFRAPYHVLQFFSPIQFLFFSGYFAAAGLRNRDRSLPALMLGRALRIYILVVFAFGWGLAIRIATAHFSGETRSLGAIWPLNLWDGPVEWRDALMHLSPIGFADHTRFNYGTWYLYQELRIVLLFPLFRWILLRKSSPQRWGMAAALMMLAAVLEYKFWMFFPLFRSSPFQSIAYGCCFLVGALVSLELERKWIETVPRGIVAFVLCIGVAVSFLESFGITPRVSNPPIVMVQTLVGQMLVFPCLWTLFHDWNAPDWLRLPCQWSVGIYIIHPPLHVLASWIAVSMGSLWPIAIEIAIAVVGGAVFYHVIERPSQGWVKTLQGRSA
jgi:peptidoglycan/LPS O-acetylase OafA/YrhL